MDEKDKAIKNYAETTFYTLQTFDTNIENIGTLVWMTLSLQNQK